MDKILKVAQREYLETVKTKIFILSVLFTPIFMAVIIFVMGQVQKRAVMGPRPAKEIAVTDLSNEVSEELKGVFERHNASNPKRQIVITVYAADRPGLDTHMEEMKDKVRQDEFDGYLVIAKDVITGEGTSTLYMSARKMTDFQLFSEVQRLVYDAVVNTRIKLHELSPELIAELRRGVPVEQLDLSAEGEKKRETMVVLMVPFFFLFLMFAGVSGTSQGMLTSVIEEKNSRVMEVLLSALSPFQLMAGKIVGLAAIGLTVIGVWALAAYGAAASGGMGDIVSPGILGYFIIYYVLGFLLMASILAAIGSACNTLREAQTLMGPVMMMFVVPMVAWFYIVQRPEEPVAVILSFIPPLTPMIMILRIAAVPDLSRLQIFASILLLAVSVPLVMWASAKIFRVGVLMYGKPPSLRELVRWVRYK